MAGAFSCEHGVSASFLLHGVWDVLKNKGKQCRFLATVCGLVLVMPRCAWALQEHGAPEGLYVHMLAHLLFISAMGYLYWDIGRTPPGGRGWRYLQIFCCLMVVWNVLTLLGHAISPAIDLSHFSAPDTVHARILPPLTWSKLIYYLAKFDHFICVPALFFLFLGTRSFYVTVDRQEGGA